MSFQTILDHYRQHAFSERDKGARFERLMQAYLQTDRRYADQFRHVWLWNEFFGRQDLGGGDTGIDLVAETITGEYWAIQCKCYREDAIIDKPAVDGFLATSGKTFRDKAGQVTRFAHRLWISTTNHWGPNATEAIKNQHPEVTRLNLSELLEAAVDWQKLEKGVHGEAARAPKKQLRPHQAEAVEKAHLHFRKNDRGQMIMACGTGKTFTSLRIAEKETKGKGLVLFLVPSIALLGQTLREWTADAEEPINAICICSDPEISRKKAKQEDSDGFSTIDLALPASTDTKYILNQFRQLREKKARGMTVVFSTYQSIEVVSKVQKALLKEDDAEFDLIICDEAHRTTGVTLSGEDESAFTKVHEDRFLRGTRRLYMTATPRLYSDDVKQKAKEVNAELCSMDKPELYGEEFYRIGFGEAVEKQLLTDYKVLILTLSDQDVPASVQRALSGGESEINADDVTKLIGTVNALSKQFIGDGGMTRATDPEPMRRAVAFCQSIQVSKKITGAYNTAAEAYLKALPEAKRESMITVQAQHIDGTMSAPRRDELLSWLKEETPEGECRVLTNVRCLSEGVDVPSLDAVLFLSARNSQVDVVQSVGRVMRRAPGKEFGYIIIPVVTPADVEPEKALDDNERYKVVWTVLNALRAHDDRFNALVNKIELNKKRPDKVVIGTSGTKFDQNDRVSVVNEDQVGYGEGQKLGQQLALKFEQLQSVVYARLVLKVGDRRYWEQWARDVAQIAERQIERIEHLIKTRKDQREAFERFLTGLQQNINPGISRQQGVEMLAQHIITQPVFEALFEGYSFVRNNPVSKAMQAMLEHLEQGSNLTKDSDTLQKFYESVRKRAEGIDNAEGKQRIIIELYDKFFKAAFPKMVEQLGIVYTPVEVVDFILHSVDGVLRSEFGRGLTEENVHILDPFTGTGTFITRLLQSGLIRPEDLDRKYRHELHANEIVLLAYYIAAINIENAYHDATPDPDDGIGKNKYVPFEGIVLTDTFQLGESGAADKLFSEMFPQNSARVVRQKKAPVRVIIGNPPYSIGQKSANDNAQNQKYARLDQRIADTYAAASTAGLNKSLYDAYIKAFRWSADRLDPEQGGVIAFVSNGAWLDGNSTDGFRKTIEREFDSIWVFSLRGNQRTSGELSRKEGGKIFGSGSRTPIAITLLVRNPAARREKAVIRYCDIGDYLSREDKLEILRDSASITSPKLHWKTLEPNEEGDWLNQRNDLFEKFIPLAPEKKYDKAAKSFFIANSLGTVTARDAWVYNFSHSRLRRNITKTISHYNEELQKVVKGRAKQYTVNPELGSWSRDWQNHFLRKREIILDKREFRNSMYRPFTKVYTYYADILNQERYQQPIFYVDSNISLFVSGIGVNKDFSTLCVNLISDYQLLTNGQCFPLYYYEENSESLDLFASGNGEKYIKQDGVSDYIFEECRKKYGKNISKEDIFYYVYGVLHDNEYRNRFSSDLKKSLPRIPLVDDVKDFWSFSKAGRALADLHINYEKVPAYKGVKVEGLRSGDYAVEKMRFPQKGQKDTILYNNSITIRDIPEKAYEYVVNGKSAIEWVMERYQVTVHKDSGIVNDPNDWAKESGNPRYILDLLLSVINVSMQTVEIVEGLPRLKFGDL
ncbi:MAG TPA: DEAD/DEAH box helicase family protein [Bacteroidia bacterium]|nr:DEAD/DEAH box helicase family protein [Bacteroidia bacterium]